MNNSNKILLAIELIKKGRIKEERKQEILDLAVKNKIKGVKDN